MGLHLGRVPCRDQRLASLVPIAPAGHRPLGLQTPPTAAAGTPSRASSSLESGGPPVTDLLPRERGRGGGIWQDHGRRGSGQ